MSRPLSMSRSSVALDNLRAVVIIVVLAFHSVNIDSVPQLTLPVAVVTIRPTHGASLRLSTATAGLASTCFAPGKTFI